jgi:hypothetical protein
VLDVAGDYSGPERRAGIDRRLQPEPGRRNRLVPDVLSSFGERLARLTPKGRRRLYGDLRRDLPLTPPED